MAEDFSIREMLEVLMGAEGKRKLRLRHKTNDELFALYDGQLVLKHRSKDALAEARRFLGHYRAFLGEYPPSPELATAFLARFSERKPNTLYRYHSIIQGFQTWYGEGLDSKIKVPETLPDYIEDADMDKLKAAMASKKTHKRVIERNLLIIETINKTGLRRKELAALRVGDVNLKRQFLVARMGKGQKDRVIDLTPALIQKLEPYLKGKAADDSVFGLSAETVSGIIHWAAVRAGVKIHTHSLRDFFATRLVDNGADIEVVRRLLGHSNLKNTQRYLARTDKQRRDAVVSLDSPPASGLQMKSPWGGSNRLVYAAKDGNADDSERRTTLRYGESGEGEETEHKSRVRSLARRLAASISLPSFTDKELWRQLPLVEPGIYYLSVGVAEVSPGGLLGVEYALPSLGAAPHLERSLNMHLSSCGLERFLGLMGTDGTLSKWSGEAGRYSQAVLSLLSKVIGRIDRQGLAMFLDDSTQPGLTKWFAVMAWHDILVRTDGHAWIDDSWYPPAEKVGDLWALKFGAFDIARAGTLGALRENQEYHKRLRTDPELMARAKDLHEQEVKLKEAAVHFRGLLEEFSDLERVPGHCELCLP